MVGPRGFVRSGARRHTAAARSQAIIYADKSITYVVPGVVAWLKGEVFEREAQCSQRAATSEESVGRRGRQVTKAA